MIYLKAGDQVPADARVLEGSLEVNESLLTGESDNLSGGGRAVLRKLCHFRGGHAAR